MLLIAIRSHPTGQKTVQGQGIDEVLQVVAVLQHGCLHILRAVIGRAVPQVVGLIICYIIALIMPINKVDKANHQPLQGLLLTVEDRNCKVLQYPVEAVQFHCLQRKIKGHLINPVPLLQAGQRKTRFQLGFQDCLYPGVDHRRPGFVKTGPGKLAPDYLAVTGRLCEMNEFQDGVQAGTCGRPPWKTKHVIARNLRFVIKELVIIGSLRLLVLLCGQPGKTGDLPAAVNMTPETGCGQGGRFLGSLQDRLGKGCRPRFKSQGRGLTGQALKICCKG